jgi:hypothetical protein
VIGSKPAQIFVGRKSPRGPACDPPTVTPPLRTRVAPREVYLRGLLVLVSLAGAGCVESGWTVCADGRVCGPGRVCDVVNHTCSLPGEECREAADGRPCADGSLVCQGGHCLPSCGDGVLNGQDQCEGADFGGQTCADYQTYRGELACDASCRIDSSGCSGACGDGTLDAEQEVCDPTDFDAASAPTCVSLGLDAGRQGCAADCAGPTDATCMRLGWSREIPGQAVGGAILDLWGTRDSLFAVRAEGVYRSSPDGAPTWDLVGPGEVVPGTALWASSTRDIWVVGGGTDSFMHWDGSRWSRITPSINGTVEIWGSSATDVFAVGKSGIIHFDGASWSVQPTPGRPSLLAVWGVGPDEVYAAGEGGRLLRYDGRQWTAIDSGTDERLTGVWAASESDLWTISPTRVRRFDGSGWRVMRTFTAEQNGLGWIAATGPSDVWISAGASGDVERYDGSTWSVLLEGLGSGAGPLWVDQTAVAVAPAVIDEEVSVRRWFGAGEGPLLVPNGDWLDVWAGRDDWIAVGTDRTTEGGGTAAHADGSLFTFEEGLVHVDATGDGRAYAAGNRGTIFVWNGAAWSISFAEPGAKYIDLWTVGATDVYALTVEEKAPSRILHYDGETWADLPSIPPPCGQTGSSGWASSTSDVYVVGDDVLARFDGRDWICHDGREVGESFISVWGSSPTDVWVLQGVGAAGEPRLHHWNGTAWTSQATTAFGRLMGTAADDIFLGNDAHYDGRVWSPIRATKVRGVLTAVTPGRLFTTNVFFEIGGLGQIVRTRFWNQRAVEASCADGVDDDGDGLTDGDDDDCSRARSRR